MCGIAGAVKVNKSKDVVTAIMGRIEHRGEPAHRYEMFCQEDCSLAMHRLGIIDESHGKQPFSDGKIVGVFNGEIYNYLDLKKRLERDFSFKTSCDSEVVLYAYKKWGLDFIHYLDGMFAIAILDSVNGSLIMARDPMGIKPLYYSKYDSGYVFCSEVKGLSQLERVIEIEELSPGSLWVNGKIEKYFELPYWSTYQGDDRNLCIQQFNNRIMATVESHLGQNVKKVALLLSGGIDSSLITYLSTRSCAEVVAYTLASPESSSQDLQAAKDLCSTYNIKHVIVQPEVEDLQEFYLEKGVFMTESFEPVLVRNAVSYHFLCRQVVKDGFKYCLNGEGADELFGGYDFVKEVLPQYRDRLVWHTLSIIHNTYLKMADRASMFTTLEARVPYMDIGLVKEALSLPSDFRVTEDCCKLMLRKISDGVLPESIVKRHKVGMNEGSGYGRNVPTESVYFQAVSNFYKGQEGALARDIGLCRRYKGDMELNFSDIEEVYNFARYIECGYHKLSQSMERLQLNTKITQKTKDLLGIK